jgi:hypothetical protein
MASEDFPTVPFQNIKETADLAWDAFSQVWALERIGNSPVLTEVTLRLTAAAEGGDATTFLRDRALHLKSEALARLGRGTQGIGIRLVSPLQINTMGPPLPLQGAEANLLVETLLEDPTRLFLEFTSKWPTLALPPMLVAEGAPLILNLDLRKPSEYLEDTYAYISGPVVDFLLESAS